METPIINKKHHDDSANNITDTKRSLESSVKKESPPLSI